MRNNPDIESDGPEPVRRVRRHVSEPFSFDVIIDMDERGDIHGIGQHSLPGMPENERRQVMRAALYVGALHHQAEERELGFDSIIAQLPDTPEFAIERSIVIEIVALQHVRRHMQNPLSALVTRGNA